MTDIILKAVDVSKKYRLGQVGRTTLREDVERLFDKIKRNRGEGLETDFVSSGDFLALDGISFSIRQGERVGIIGHNGAGKSTLLKLISRVTVPSTGDIYFNGRVASMLEVGTGFHAELTGRENIYMNGAILGMKKKEIDAKLEDIIDFSECRKFIDTPVKRYSSGMYVKLAFSVAAHLDAEIMIMDEVLAVGDMAFQRKCLDKMNDVSQRMGRTILYVSHNMETIRQLCNRVILLDHGRIVFDGDVESGIERYLQEGMCNNLSIDYSNVRKRTSQPCETQIRTLSATYFDRESIIFNSGEKIPLCIRWINESDVENVSLRVTICRIDRTAVGSFFLNNFYSGNKSDIACAKILLDVTSLVDGQYFMSYTFFSTGQYGAFRVLDSADGLFFSIVSNSKVLWNSRHFGAVRFPDINLVSLS